MTLRPLHYSQRSSSPVQINYHWCSINGSFQISPRRMPLICSQCLSGVDRSATVPMPVICEEEKLPTVLLHIPSVGGSNIMTLLTTAAPDRISPRLHIMHFLCTAKCHVCSQVKDRGTKWYYLKLWMTNSDLSPSDGGLLYNLTHIAFVC